MSSLDWAGVIAKLESGLDLLPEEAQSVMREVLEDRADKEIIIMRLGYGIWRNSWGSFSTLKGEL